MGFNKDFNFSRRSFSFYNKNPENEERKCVFTVRIHKNREKMRKTERENKRERGLEKE